MNFFKLILRDLKRWLRRKHMFAVDVESYEMLRLVAAREKSTPQEVASRLFEQAAQEQDVQEWAAQCWDRLSPRQKQITAHVCQGSSTRQIATHLNIAQTTVKTHIETVLAKFSLNSRAALRQLMSPWDLSDYL